MPTESKKKTGKGARRDPPQPSLVSRWEWVVAAFSALLLLGAVGTLLYEVLASPGGPPRLEIAMDSIVPQHGAFVVTFHVENRGSTTALGLQVRGELQDDTTTVESATTTVQSVPAGATQGGGLFFSHDPRRYRLVLTPVGYEAP